MTSSTVSSSNGSSRDGSASTPPSDGRADGKPTAGKPRRRCLLFVVDALAEAYIREAIEDARLPHLAELLEEGGQLVRCTSIFPSITPAATCTLATGAYPEEHHVEGAYWIDQSTGEMAYFGDDFELVRKRGLHRYLVDFGERLNAQRLDAPTIFERVEAEGLSAGCVNYMWFHGDHLHHRATPWSLRALAGRLSGSTRGPEVLLLGDFVTSWPRSMRPPRWNRWGLWHRYGFDDASTMGRLMEMAKQDCLPDFTLAYFPNNDYESHGKGPRRALETAIRPFDEFLGRFVRSLGGWKKFREAYALLIVGDHAQSRTADDPLERGIELEEILDGLGIADAAGKWQEGERIYICPNMRAAAIYQREPEDTQLREEIVARLLAEKRVDQVIWEESRGYCVKTADRGQFRFARVAPDRAALRPTGESQGDDWEGAGQSEVVRDDRGNLWRVAGDWRALDMKVAGSTSAGGDSKGGDSAAGASAAGMGGKERLLEYGNYPNALERIARCFPAGSSPVWATARLGCEFKTSETSTHPGGSHGGLNWEDSDAALLTFGLPRAIPDRVASVDVMPLCLQALGIGKGGLEEVSGTRHISCNS